ncbi:MAG: MOSC domain-containing protein [Actinomycetota bacterium]|nr:MOSC domain-containing protein [Actinomycetota bacterium]
MPADFAWPGRFLGRWPSGSWCVLFGVPPGVVYGSVEADAVEAAFVVAAHEPRPRVVDEAPAGGRVLSLFVAPAACAPMRAVESVGVVAGRGLEGDRYFDGAGTFSEKGSTGRDVTLVDAAALEAAGVEFSESRRNVVVRGIDLDALIGRSFRIGEVECFGRRRCEPCAHLQRLTRPGVLRALVHRGGLRADVVSGGVLRVGDGVTA